MVPGGCHSGSAAQPGAPRSLRPGPCSSCALQASPNHHTPARSSCAQELAETAPGFVNASVEFDVASLRPTYRLMWGAAGESNALAVAQGLGFAPNVVAAAREVRPPALRCCGRQLPAASWPVLGLQRMPAGLRNVHELNSSPPALHAAPSHSAQVAAELHHSSQASGKRSAMLQASLLEQLEKVRQAAGEAAAARAAAEAALAAAQAELAAAQEMQAELRQTEAEVKSAGAKAQQATKQLLADVRAGRKSAREAEEALRAMERQAAPPESAALRLMGLRAAAQVDVLRVGLGAHKCSLPQLPCGHSACCCCRSSHRPLLTAASATPPLAATGRCRPGR